MRFRARGASLPSGLRGDSRPFDKLRAGSRLSGGAKPRRALSATIDETKTRRAMLARTAGGGCPYVSFAFSCKLTRDETPPFHIHSAVFALLDPSRIRVRLQ